MNIYSHTSLNILLSSLSIIYICVSVSCSLMYFQYIENHFLVSVQDAIVKIWMHPVSTET